MAAISNDWLEPLTPEFRKPYYAKLYKTILTEYNSRLIFPAADDIFNAFNFTPLSKVKFSDRTHIMETDRPMAFVFL